MTPERERICPSCGYEYESWVEVCPDCNVLIESRPVEQEPLQPQLGRDEDPEWTVVTNVPNAIIGNLIKNQLQDADIPVLMTRAPSADIAQFSHNDYVPHDLRVPRRLMDTARRIVDGVPTEEEDGPPWDSGWEGGDYYPANGEFDTTDVSDENSRDGGWAMLSPHMSGYRPGGSTRSPAPTGWYWSDDAQTGEPVEYDGRESTPTLSHSHEYEQEEYEDEPPEREYEWDYYGEGSGRPSRWVKVMYGILIAALSLPFILQLIQRLLAVFE